jgi:D-sedoheptulose 7-phosphate isomerase
VNRAMDDVRGFSAAYLREAGEVLSRVPVGTVVAVSDVLLDAYLNGRLVVVLGNGGSASNASHFVCDLVKGTIVSGKKGFRAMALSDNTPLATACANDYGYVNVFKAQIRSMVQEGDVVVAISGSGNSENVLRAVSLAHSLGATTVALTGCGGGKLAGLADHAVVVPSDNMEHIEDTHLVLTHLIKTYLRDRIADLGNAAAAPEPAREAESAPI